MDTRSAEQAPGTGAQSEQREPIERQDPRYPDLEFTIIDLNNNQSVTLDAHEIAAAGSEYHSPVEAFNRFLDKSVCNALDRDYSAPMGFLKAVLDLGYEGGKFSWIKLAKFGAALAIGGTASIFAITPAGDAVRTLASIYRAKTGHILAGENILVVIAQAVNTGRSAMLVSYSAMRMIETYLGKTSREEKYLRYEEASCAEISKKTGRKVLDLACAVAANIPTFLTTKSMGIPLAAAASLANASVAWLGMSNLKLWPEHVYPARRAEAGYLREQIETFLKLSFEQQNAILDDVDALRRNALRDGEYHKKLYARLLNLCRPIPAVSAEAMLIQERRAASCKEKAVSNGMGVWSVIPGFTFVTAAGLGTAGLFHDSDSADAIMAGLGAALLALLPNVGFGFLGGSHAGKSIVTDEIPLAQLQHPRVREALKWLLYFVNLLAGGTIFTFSYDAISAFTSVTKIKEPLEDILKAVTIGVCFSGSYFSMGHYLLSLLDEILIYFAQRCGNEQIRRLYAFVLEMRRLEHVLMDMNAENYRELLSWKLEGGTQLTELLHVIFDNRLSDIEYARLQADMNARAVLLRDRATLPHYQVMPDFFVKQEKEKSACCPGLRRRFVHGLFSCAETEAGRERKAENNRTMSPV